MHVAVCGLATACDERAPAPRVSDSVATAERPCDAPAARAVVERLGERLQQVSLQAPDSVARREIRAAYAPLVTSELLAAWTAEPSRAPGRQTSSPWPERIEVRSTTATDAGTCRVDGEVVSVTSVELARGGAAVREPVTLEVVRDHGGWRVDRYGTHGAVAHSAVDSDRHVRAADGPNAPSSANDGAHDDAHDDAQAAADVVRRYYAAIDAREFRRAYALWGGDGAASGQTFAAFARGFAETAHVEADVGAPGRVEGAAGSRYVEVPVTVRAVTRAGAEQRFAGRYTLRRSVVDGATPAQRRWHIHSARVSRVATR